MDPLTIAAGVGVAGNIIGGIGSAKKKKKALKRFYKKAGGVLGEEEEDLRQSLAGEEQQARRSLSETVEGYDRARKDIDIGANVARERIGQTGKKLAAQATQDVVGAGKAGTSASLAAQRGVFSDVARAVADLDVRLGREKSELEQNRVEAVGRARNRLSAYYRQRGNVRSDVAGSYLGLLSTYYGQGMNIPGGSEILGGSLAGGADMYGTLSALGLL